MVVSDALGGALMRAAPFLEHTKRWELFQPRMVYEYIRRILSR